MAKVRVFSSPQNHDKPPCHLARSLPNNFLVRHSNSLDLSFPLYKIEKDTAGDNQTRPMDNQVPASSPQNSVFIRLPLLKNLLWLLVFILVPATAYSVSLPRIKCSLITHRSPEDGFLPALCIYVLLDSFDTRIHDAWNYNVIVFPR